MIIRTGNKQIYLESQQFLNLYIAGAILQPIYFFLLGTLSNIFSFPTFVFTYIYYGGLWCLLLFSLPRIMSLFNKNVFVGFLFAIAFIATQCLFFPQNEAYIVGFDFMMLSSFQPSSLITALPYLLIGMAVCDTDGLLKVLHTSARVGIIAGFLAYAVNITNNFELRYDDMTNAYGIVVLICLLIVNQKKGDIYFIVSGGLCLILAGTRGPLLCMAVAILIKFVLLEKDPVKRIIRLILSALIVISLSFGLLEILLELIADGFSAIGVDKLRIVDYMREGMITDSSGRDTLMTSVMDKLWEQPFWGYGAGGDRLFLRKGSYVHNIVLELWFSYGIFVGSAIVFLIGYWVLKAIKSGTPSLRIIAIWMFSCVIMKLLMSSSYLSSKELFILLGVCIVNINACKNNQNRKGENLSEC